MSHTALTRAIKASPGWATFCRAYRNATHNLDEEKLFKELMGMHAVRRVRKLTAHSIMADVVYQLSEAAAQNQAYRSRAVSIYVQLYMAHGDISELNDRFWRLTSTLFGAQMAQAGFKSQASKLEFYANLIPSVYERMSYLSRIMTVCQTVIEDMDSARFSLTQQNQVFAHTARDR